jgi:hypothetical protein
MTRRILLLGVGAQRCGTSWLHNYLSTHPQVETGLVKEYHLFDVLYLPKLDEFKQYTENRLRETLAEIKQSATDDQLLQARLMRDKLLLYFYSNPKYYFEYWNSIFNQNQSVPVVADITPSYSALRGEHYQEIDQMAQQAGMEVKVIFIMRDPVERIFSAARKYETLMPQYIGQDKSPEEIFLDVYKDEKTQMRTRYEETVEALEKAFPPERIACYIYEQFFSEPSIQELTTFLEIDYLPADLQKFVNKSERQDELSDQAAQQAREFYSKTYDYCIQQFGREVIKENWCYA